MCKISLLSAVKLKNTFNFLNDVCIVTKIKDKKIHLYWLKNRITTESKLEFVELINQE